jgi:hypothetical protein
MRPPASDGEVLTRRRRRHDRPAARAEIEREGPSGQADGTDPADDVQPSTDDGGAAGARLGHSGSPRQRAVEREDGSGLSCSRARAVAADDVQTTGSGGDKRMVDGGGKIGQTAPAPRGRRVRIGSRRRGTIGGEPADDDDLVVEYGCADLRPRLRKRCGGKPGKCSDGELRPDHVETSPTTSPRLFSTGMRPTPAEPEGAAIAGRSARMLPSSTFRTTPHHRGSPRRDPRRRPSRSSRDTAASGRCRSHRGRSRSARVGRHRADDAGRRRAARTANVYAMRSRSTRTSGRRSVDGNRDVDLGHLRRAGDLGEKEPLHRWSASR